MLPLPVSSHDWIRRFAEQIQRLRPDLSISVVLELGVMVHQVASAFLPEQVAVLSALERVPGLHDKVCMEGALA